MTENFNDVDCDVEGWKGSKERKRGENCWVAVMQ